MTEASSGTSSGQWRFWRVTRRRPRGIQGPLRCCGARRGDDRRAAGGRRRGGDELREWQFRENHETSGSRGARSPHGAGTGVALPGEPRNERLAKFRLFLFLRFKWPLFGGAGWEIGRVWGGG